MSDKSNSLPELNYEEKENRRPFSVRDPRLRHGAPRLRHHNPGTKYRPIEKQIEVVSHIVVVPPKSISIKKPSTQTAAVKKLTTVPLTPEEPSTSCGNLGTQRTCREPLQPIQEGTSKTSRSFRLSQAKHSSEYHFTVSLPTITWKPKAIIIPKERSYTPPLPVSSPGPPPQISPISSPSRGSHPCPEENEAQIPWRTPPKMDLPPPAHTWRGIRSLIPVPKVDYSYGFVINPGEEKTVVPRYIDRDRSWNLIPIEIPRAIPRKYFRSGDPRSSGFTITISKRLIVLIERLDIIHSQNQPRAETKEENGSPSAIDNDRLSRLWDTPPPRTPEELLTRLQALYANARCIKEVPANSPRSDQTRCSPCSWLSDVNDVESDPDFDDDVRWKKKEDEQ